MKTEIEKLIEERDQWTKQQEVCFLSISKSPLPTTSCTIDVKLKCGSVLIGCDCKCSDKSRLIIFDATQDFYNIFYVDEDKITDWRMSK